ncbi:hypothetical protein [Parasitella parasitica]|uniref:U6 snRNA phosphodiesterase 1 n=1 Tax=Parasitella parasitica TaxID=35722 RepID=A0A0B7NG04_9FUNG|nr:hypothetical protein [Parasitella parasitica]
MNSLKQYTSSDDEVDADDQLDEKSAIKRIVSNNNINESVPKMPKLPSFFDQQKAEQSKKDHQGRVRSVPHQHNSWATYVYCKVDLSSEVQKLLPHLKEAELLPEHHISLSRPVYLQKHQLNSFKAAVRASLRNSSRFYISFAQVSQLTNDEKTRSFLTLEIGHGYNQLFEFMTCVDKVMKRYHKPTFYQPPRFHASIAWSLKESTIESINIPPKLTEEIAKDVFNIDKVYIKMGHILEIVLLE